MPDLTYPAYYDMDGAAVYRNSEQEFPMIVRPDGSEVPLKDPIRFGTAAMRITKEEFDELVSEDGFEVNEPAPAG